VKEIRIQAYFVIGDEMFFWRMNKGKFMWVKVSFIFSSFSLAWVFIPSFFIVDFWALGGRLMVKEIVFDVGRKIHCVPWKYKKVFYFCFILFCLDFLV
jgi:hypothetical protein